MKMRIVPLVSIVALAAVLAPPAGAADAAAPAAAAPAAEPLYATVDGKAITQQEFVAAFNNHLRQKFYHGQVQPDQVDAARKEVADKLIDRLLMLDEAKRRGIAADEASIDKTVAEYDARYAGSPRWQQSRELMLPGLKKQLIEQEVLRQVEAAGRSFAEPTDEAVQAFYKTRIDLFTQPEKLRLHTILLRVDPSSPKSVWDAAREEAARIVARLRAGDAKFEELAALHSQDTSAERGGDMGYLHMGMVPEAVQTRIDAFPPGSVGDPVDVLEGVAIFRLDERVPPQVMAYADVAARARELLKRELSEQAWKDFLAGLRKSAVIKFHESPTPPAAKN